MCTCTCLSVAREYVGSERHRINVRTRVSCVPDLAIRVCKKEGNNDETSIKAAQNNCSTNERMDQFWTGTTGRTNMLLLDGYECSREQPVMPHLI
jgi:hypothetical protein